MNSKIRQLTTHLQEVHSGDAWFGRAIFTLLAEVDPEKVYVKKGAASHSMIELLYHMITWAEFTLKRIEKDQAFDLAQSEALDWRPIDPERHSWKKGLSMYRQLIDSIAMALKGKDDSFLDERVDFRNYHFGYLLNGLIEHSIYHAGQIALLHKMEL